jgi:hypothetical protein
LGVSIFSVLFILALLAYAIFRRFAGNSSAGVLGSDWPERHYLVNWNVTHRILNPPRMDFQWHSAGNRTMVVIPSLLEAATNSINS